MASIRVSSEPGERQPIDVVYLVSGAIGVVVLGVWSHAEGDLDLANDCGSPPTGGTSATVRSRPGSGAR